MIWPAIIQQFSVNPTEADKEAPYIKANIDATRAAYDLEDIEVEPYTTRSGVGNTGLAQLASSTSTVPLVDPQVVNRTFEQLQQVRAYYSVADRSSTSTATTSTTPSGHWCSASASSTRPASPRVRATGPTSTPSTPTATG